MKGLTVLGATGSIGVATLEVVALNPDRFRVVALSGNHDVGRMEALCRTHHPSQVVMVDQGAAAELTKRLADLPIAVHAGAAPLQEVVALPEVDLVMAAIVGAAGLYPTLAAARSGKTVLLANKEALVMSGGLFMDTVRCHGATLIPVDSEQNAMFQCLSGYRCGDSLEDQGVKKIFLTGSGGPFLRTPLEDLLTVTPDQACNHPNWSMGRKISVDSATMMNKGLEVIETSWLFNCDLSSIEIVIHPQSLVHSMVEFVDGSIMAQLGSPDMRIPIAHALGFPERVPSGATGLNLFQAGELQFEEPDLCRYPCLRLAFESLQSGGRACTILNAANEVAVEAFLKRNISFTRIAELVAEVLDQIGDSGSCSSLEEVVALDGLARQRADQQISRWRLRP